MATAVADSSPLIALFQIDQLELLGKLLGDVVIPPAVAREISPTLSELPPWIEVRSPAQPMSSQVLRAALGPGESETISLALELDPEKVVLDERPARRLALSLGLPVVGTLGLLLRAKETGLVDAVRPSLEALVRVSFRLSRDLFDDLLLAAGE